MTLESLLQRDDIPEDVKREIELEIADQRKTEADFLKTKTRLQFLLKSSPAIIFSCESWGNFPTTFMSENVKEIIGYEAYEFIDNPSFWINGIHPDDRQRSVDIFEGLVQSEHYSETYRFKHKNGSYLWMMDEASLIRDKQGNPIEIVGYWTDITKQKEVEEKLRTSEEKYRSLFENIPIGLYRSTPDHKFLAANPTFVKQVGLSSFEDLLSLDPDKLATRRNYQRNRFLEEINAKGEVKGLEFELKNSDGTSIYIRENARAIKDSKGTIICYEGSVEDITDRVLTEEALRESEERYRSLIDNLSDIVIELDSEGNFTFISPQVVEVLGYQPEEEIGKSGFDFIHPDDMGRALEVFQKVFTGKQIYNFEYRAKHKDDHYVPMSVSGRIIEENDDFKLISILRDITERKKVEEALKESEEKYRLLFESAPISIGISTVDGEAIAFNQKTCEIMGYSADELAIVDLNETYVNPENRKITLQKLLSSGSIKGWEVQRKRKDGTEYYVVLNAQIVEQGGQKVILSTMQDITQNKIAEEQLQRSEERYRMLFNESPISLWELDGSNVKQYIDKLMSNGIKNLREYFEIHPGEVKKIITKVRILDINSATLKLYKAKRKEDLLQDMSVVFGKETLLAFKEIILLEGKPTFEIETVNYTLEGDKIHVLVRLTLIPGYEETFTRLIVSIVNITDRIEMVKALRESEEKYRSFLENFQGIAFKGYEDFSAGFFLGRIEEITGYTEEEFISGEIVFNQLIHSDDSQWVGDDVEKFMSSSQRATQREYRIIDKNSNIHWIQESIQKFYDEKQNRRGVYGTLQDITDRKRAEEALRENQELFTQFMDHLPAAAFIKDKDSVTLYANKYLKDVFGGEKWIGKTVMELFPEETARKMIADDQKALNEGLQIITEELIDKHNVANTYQTYKFPIKRKNKERLLGGIAIDITPQKKAEELLRNERENFYNILNSTNDRIYIVNSQFEIEFVNDALKREFGSVEGRTCYEYFNKFDKMCSWCTIKEILDGKTVRWEKTRTQNQKTYDIIDTPFRNLDGSISLLSILRDITKRKQTEEALRESEAKYRNLVEQAQDGIVIVQGGKLGDKIIFNNRRFAQLLGYRTEELLNTPYAQVVHPEVLPEINKRRKARLAGKKVPLIYDSKLIRKDGTPLEVGLNLGMIHYQGEDAVLAIVRDITDRKRVQDALKESEERLRKFMESATDGFTLLDSDLNFIDMNKAGLRGLGLSKEEVVGKNLLDIFPALRNIERFDKYLEVIKTGIPYDSDDIYSTPRIGDKYFSVRAFKVGEGLGVITTDITDRMRAEKTREELEQRRDSFVWMTSHELRTPLTVLTGYCDFLIEHLNDLAQKRITNILGVMKSNLDRLERLTSKVSAIGQIERGSFEIEKTSMNLCDFLQGTLEPYHQLLGNQFEFQGCLEDSSIIIAGDAHRLQQVLDNIVGNAIKQTDKDHRRIRVTSKIEESYIKIEVSDNGAGIEPENLEVIFDQFVSIPTEFSATGTGIGLYLCRKTLEAHGGRITAQSKGLGLGATFIVEIPRTNTVESQKF